MFSRACEYGIRASLFISEQSLNDERVNLRQISTEINSPEAFTAKILQKLSKNGLVNSIQGPTGGFQMDESMIHSIKLSDIVHAIDGDSIYKGCALGLKKCNAKLPCPLHDHFVSIRDNLQKMLEETTLYELSEDLAQGLTFLKR